MKKGRRTEGQKDQAGDHKQAQDDVVAHHPGTGSVATTLGLVGAGHSTLEITAADRSGWNRRPLEDLWWKQ